MSTQLTNLQNYTTPGVLAGTSLLTVYSASEVDTLLASKQGSISSVLSAATAGGSATESVVVTGLLTTSTILAVSQSVKGSNSLPLLGFTNSTNGHLTIIYSADMGTGAKVIVTFI